MIKGIAIIKSTGNNSSSNSFDDRKLLRLDAEWGFHCDGT